MSSCPDYQPEPSNKVSDSYEGPDDGPPKLPKWAEQSAPDDVDGMTGLPKSVACNVDETPLVDDKFYIQFGDCPYLPYFSNRIQADRFARHVNNAIREAIEEARRELPGKTIEWGCGHTAEASCEECRNRDFERLNQLNMGVQRIAVEKASQRGGSIGPQACGGDCEGV